jgi:hypothetical protein
MFNTMQALLQAVGRTQEKPAWYRWEKLQAEYLFEHFAAIGFNFDRTSQTFTVVDKDTGLRLLEMDMLLKKMRPKARKYALQQGVSVIEVLSDGTIKLDMPADFSPKAW